MLDDAPLTISSIDNHIVVTLEPGDQLSQLARLQADFGFRILHHKGDYTLSTDDNPERPTMLVTPAFDSLQELEHYVDKNMVDILYNYLFEVSAEHDSDTQQQA
jgi:hypothetical protein